MSKLSKDATSVLADVAHERARQVSVEGWDAEHDDKHAYGEIAAAAACYALSSISNTLQMDIKVGHRGRWTNGGWAMFTSVLWPWDWSWWKPKSPRQDLVRAAALIVAEIERIDRAQTQGAARPQGGE